MAGIYIHIPFCKRACSYCDFHFLTNLHGKEKLVEALLREIELRRDFFSDGETVNTIYFGGGTPSLLSVREAEALLNAVYKTFTVRAEPEITLECNPDDLTPEKTRDLKAAGINRLSVGIQSFFDEHLAMMRRSHDSAQAFAALKNIADAGFVNFTADLIYGLPGLTLEQWQKNLDIFIEHEIPHISAYNLTVEPGTPLALQVEKKRVHLPEDERVLRQFDLLADYTASRGYAHYEISNFALSGFKSLHNGNYWKGVPYLGIGPAAHSFDGKVRSFNPADNRLYENDIFKDKITAREETLTETDRYNEFVMTSLRTAEGISLNAANKKFGDKTGKHLLKVAEPFRRQGRVKVEGDHIRLTRTGMYIADFITSDFFR